MVAIGCRLFQRLVHAGYVDIQEAAPFFWPDGHSGPVACGVPNGVRVNNSAFLTYLVCITLASKAYAMRSGSNSIGRRIRMALRTMGADKDQAEALWDNVIDKEYDVLDALDWRVMDCRYDGTDC